MGDEAWALYSQADERRSHLELWRLLLSVPGSEGHLDDLAACET